MATTTYRYVEIDPRSLPLRVTWYTPPRNRGQMVEVSYGGVHIPGAANVFDEGDEYKRVWDASVGSPTYPGASRYYRRVETTVTHVCVRCGAPVAAVTDVTQSSQWARHAGHVTRALDKICGTWGFRRVVEEHA